MIFVRVAYVLRLEPNRLAEGVLFGEIEEVATGSQVAVRSINDITRFLRPSLPQTLENPDREGRDPTR